MTPNFALDLSFDGIALFHRAGAGDWHVLGEVALDAEDLAAELAALRTKALALDPSGLATELIIPDAQIRYLDIPAASAPHGDHDAAAAEALEGATPYALHELAYDWTVSGARLQIAAVARETLEEAEAFATEHGFNPVCFGARPAPEVFTGLPSFGPTARAEAAAPPAPAPVSASPAEDDAPPEARPETPPETEPAPAPLFSSIRAERGAPPDAAPRLEGVARFTPTPPLPDTAARALSGAAAASLAPRTPEPDPVAPADPPDAKAAPKPPAPPAPAPATRTAPAPTPVVPAPRKAPAPRDEAERLTIFGARETEAARRGKPRFLGLILTAALLLLMIGVAALASIFPDSGLGRLFRGDEPQIAVTPDIPELAIAAPEPVIPPPPAPSVLPEIAAEPDPAPEPEPEVSPAAEIIAAPETAPEPARVWTPPQTPEEARARYAATGIWPNAPEAPAEPPGESLDSFYQTSIDEGLNRGDAVALPDPKALRAEPRPPTPPLPPPPGRVFALDARGLVEATPEGVRSPAGVLVRAGPPPVRPALMPVRAVPVPGLAPTEEALEARERLSGIRPRVRPGNLTEQQERGALGGRSRSELAVLRPRLRPDRLAVAALAPDAAAIDAALAEATEQAVVASLKPRLRPQGLAPAPRTVAPATAEIDDGEPEATQTAAPRIPTSASIAQRATSRNAINLRQVNLIGVYGTAADRRALVRLANGRYQKVQVGDRIDGGRVSAIGDGELRYTKGSRDVVLRMPKG